MEYTDKEKKGIDKVDRMNRLFDRVLMPAVGILIILLLISFIINKFNDKFGYDSVSSDGNTSQSVAEPRVFTLRRELLSGYPGYVSEFKAYGYKPVEGYAYDLSLCKTVDSEMSIFQFTDGTLGELTIINYFPDDKSAGYDSLSLAVSSHKLLNVTVKTGEEKYSVSFWSVDFSRYNPDDEEQYQSLIKLVSKDDITAMYDIFETDIGNLAKSCKTG